MGLLTSVGPYYLETFAKIHTMAAPHCRTIATQEHGFGFFFPGTTNLVTAEAHSD
jgi:hypothetical protein